MAKQSSKTGKQGQAKQPAKKRSWLRILLKLAVVTSLVIMVWAIYLDAQVRHRFEGKRWALPAQVYARPLEIYEGQALNKSNLEQELALLQYRKRTHVQTPGDYTFRAGRINIYARSHELPEGPQEAAQFSFKLNGDVVSELKNIKGPRRELHTLEPLRIGGIYPAIKEERELIAFEALPKDLIKALLATEDRDFYSHFGVSPLAIARAMWVNMQAGRVVQGGSTLTQQLVKNLYLSRERSLWRKANEAVMALLLELHYSKQDILETYVNDIYLGQAGATAVHGFAMGSQFYFAKELAYCDLHELALLVAMIKGPSYYDPRRHPARAKTRRNLVLELMHQAGDISSQAMHEAKAQPLGVLKKAKLPSNRYPAFMDLVKRQLKLSYSEDDLRTEGLKIYTTLDPQLQHNLELSSQKVMPKLASKNGQALQLGAVYTGVGTGEVLAILGDKDPRYQGFNRALDAQRQIGSLVKPAVFLTALMQPERYHLASLLDDSPFRIEFDNGDQWQPKNFDNKSHGQVPLYQALAGSSNISTARLGLELGVESVRETLQVLGVDAALNPYPSILLGAQNLSPYQVSKFYQTIASNGFNMPLRAIREVQTQGGETLSRYPFSIEQVVPAEAIYLIQHALQKTMTEGTGRSAYQRLPAALKLAGKTGTTNDGRDSWFAGFSGDYLGVVWVGFDDNRASQLTGSSAALKVWTELMARTPQYPLEMVQPADVQQHWFDLAKGERTEAQCRSAQALPLWGDADTIPMHSCSQGYSSWKGWLKSWF